MASRTARSGGRSRATSSAAAPSRSTSTSKPSRSSAQRSVSRMSGSSSTKRILNTAHPPRGREPCRQRVPGANQALEERLVGGSAATRSLRVHAHGAQKRGAAADRHRVDNRRQERPHAGGGRDHPSGGRQRGRDRVG